MASPDLVLVSDIGGTNSRFGVVEAGQMNPRDIKAIDNDTFAGLHEAIPDYIKRSGNKPVRAVLAVAGPMKDGTVHLTNRRGWSFKPEELAQKTGLSRIDTVNDFAALAEALPYLPDDGLAPLGGAASTRNDATKVVLGPGTGLGVAALAFRDGSWFSVPSEAGHIELAAVTARESAVYDVLRGDFGRVSAELVASGEGLERLDAAIAKLDGASFTPREGAAISAAARDGEARGREVMQMFFDALARFSGDMALAFVANGGVYIGGGVLMKTRDLMDAGRFRAAFEAKRPHEKLVGNIATVLITANYVTLTGCAAIAARG
jgi:glucokinase